MTLAGAPAAADAASGDVRWSRDTGARIAASGTLVSVPGDGGGGPQRLFIVGNDDGYVHAFDAHGGDVVWTARIEDARLDIAPAPLPGLGATVFVVPDGRVVALGNADGERLWPDVVALGEDIAAPPAVAVDGTVVVATLAGRLHRIAAATGARVGEPFNAPAPLLHAALAAPDGGLIVTLQSVVGSIVQLAAGSELVATLSSLDRLPEAAPVLDQDGRRIVASGGRVEVISPFGAPRTLASDVDLPVGLALTPDGRVLWVAGRMRGGGGRLRALELDPAGREAPEAGGRRSIGALTTTLAPPTGAPAVGADGSAYVTLRDGVVLGVDVSGARRLEYRAAGARFRAAPVLGAGALFVGDANGTVHVLELDSESGGGAPWPTAGQNAQRTGQERQEYALPGETLGAVSDSVRERLDVEPLLAQMVPGGNTQRYDTVVASRGGRFEISLTRTDPGAGQTPVTTKSEPYLKRVYDVPVQRLEVAEPLAIPVNADPELAANGPTIRDASGAESERQPFIWHAGSRTLYAATPGFWRVEWQTGRGTRFSVPVQIDWPSDPARIQQMVLGAPAVRLTAPQSFTHAFAWPPRAGDASATPLENGSFRPDRSGRSVVVLADAPDPSAGERLAFLVVEAVEATDPRAFLGTRRTPIGAPIDHAADFPGAHREPERTPGVLRERARVRMSTEESAGFHDRAERTGPIVPVNLDDPATGDDDLLLAFYQRSPALLEVGGGEVVSAFPGWPDEDRFYGPGSRRRLARATHADVYWPAKTARYLPAWPQVGPGEGQARELVIAAQATERIELDPAVFREPRIYRQPDPAQPGYNPNEEHAFVSGRAVLAVRSDLNAPETSEPYVLVEYADPEGLAKMLVVKVTAENERHGFLYDAIAGQPINVPSPLLELEKTRPVSFDPTVTFEDRSGGLWAYRAGHGGESVATAIRYCYEPQAGFDTPEGVSTDCPGEETMFSWLSIHAGRERAARGEDAEAGAPVDVRYVVRWPADAAVLKRGQTLTRADRGLPAIHGRNVRLLYQQSAANGRGDSVRLLDVTRPREVDADLPKVLRHPRSELIDGRRRLFPELPPHLVPRLYYDTRCRKLGFRGLYLGDDGRTHEAPPRGGNQVSVLSNVMSAEDAETIGATLGGDAAFDAAIDALHRAAAGPIVPAAGDAGPFEAPRPLAAADPAGEGPPGGEGPEDGCAGAGRPAAGLALVAADTGAAGYVSFVAGNGGSDAEDPRVEVIRVDGQPERGSVIVMEPESPFAEQVYVRHSRDFFERLEDYEFRWETTQPDGDCAGAGGSSWASVASENRNDYLITGQRQFQDLCVRVRYRLRGGDGAWTTTDAQFVEGWLRRVTAGVNLFDSAKDNFRDEAPRTATNLLEQIGGPCRGVVPLNNSTDILGKFGLLEIYCTVYERALKLSIDNALPNGAMNEELQGYAGRLAAIHLIAANEASADAMDPTILVQGAQARQFIEANTSEYPAFRGQVRSFLEEELALLRGIGEDTQATRRAPVHNRLRWNLTDADGEIIYVLNYQINDSTGQDEGAAELSEREGREQIAQRDYPLGHGDAYGHLLSVLKVYYRLIRNPHFEWTVGHSLSRASGEVVRVDYFDEQMFAEAAQGRARTALAVADLTHRGNFRAGPAGALRLTEEVETRAQGEGQLPPATLRWGVADWASRGGQGAYLDWVVGNALLPPPDEAVTSDLLGALDRNSVHQIRDLAATGAALQTRLDAAAAGFNPLGVPDDLVPFNAYLARQVREKSSAFPLLDERAEDALRDARDAVDAAVAARAQMAGLDQAGGDLRRRSQEEEADLEGLIVDYHGTPFPSHMGPGRPYASDYDGPDLDNYHCIEESMLPGRSGGPAPGIRTFRFDANAVQETEAGATLTLNGGVGEICTGSPGERRAAPGRIQEDLRGVLRAVHDLEMAGIGYGNLIDRIRDRQEALTFTKNVNRAEIEVLENERGMVQSLNQFYLEAHSRRIGFLRVAEGARFLASAAAEKIPTVVGGIIGFATGTVTDFGAPLRAAALLAGSYVSGRAMTNAGMQEIGALDAASAKELVRLNASVERVWLGAALRDRALGDELRALIREEPLRRAELYAHLDSVQHALARYRATLETAERLRRKRNRLRTMRAVDLENLRYTEAAWRLLRREAVERYRARFDDAQVQVMLLARQLDFETNYAPEDPEFIGSRFLEELVRLRTLGQLGPDGPVEAAGGLAGMLVRLREAYDRFQRDRGVGVETTETLEVREGLFRIGFEAGDDNLWREELRGRVVGSVADVPELAGCCRDLPDGHALVIRFGTPLISGGPNLTNHFGLPKRAGEQGFNDSRTGAMLTAVSVRLHGSESRLVEDPQVWLYPAGLDSFRGPQVGPRMNIRTWNLNGTLGERGFAPFVALTDDVPDDQAESEFYSRQFFGRSIYNTDWFLIIPMRTLLPPEHDTARTLEYFLGDDDHTGISEIDVLFRIRAFEPLPR